MKNTLLFALLVASLGLNVWFALARPRARATADEGAPAHAGTANGTSATRAGASAAQKTAELARPIVWDVRGDSNDDLRTLTTNLRAAGFPPSVVARIVSAMLRERAYAKVAELPFWQLNSNNREARKLQLEAGRELLRLQEEILGASGSQLATMDPNHRRERYGNLSDEKVAALLKIERDYQDMANDLAPSGGLGSEEEISARRTQYMTLEKERLADIKAALGPEAYAEFERENSGAAATVLRGLRDLKVTEEEYDALFAAQKEREPNDSAMFFSSTVEADKLPSTYAFYDKVRTLLGDERGHTYLKAADWNYAQIARFTEKYPNLTPAATYELYRLNNEVRLATTRRAADRAQPVDGDKLRQTLGELNARLETLLGPEVANAYRSQGMGSALRFAARSAPANGTAAPSGATPTPPKG